MAKSKLRKREFINIVNSIYEINSHATLSQIQKNLKDDYNVSLSLPAISIRIKGYRKRGDMKLQSGNRVSQGEILKGTSTLYDSEGNVSVQWVKTNVEAEEQVDAIMKAVKKITKTISPLAQIDIQHKLPLYNDLATLYISNDIHFGALMWAPETGQDWDINIAMETVKESYDFLFATSPNSKVGIIADLGDLMEVDDFKNATPHSGNILSVDGRYPKILRAAYESLIYGIQRALEKHEIVKFVNISGNHDITTGHAVREIIAAYFRNEPRVIIDDSPSPIKYHVHGKVLIQFAHGDGLKLRDAGETMAVDCQEIFSDSKFRFAHFGHNHKDSTNDGRILKAESHRNMAPLNDWAFHKGFRGPIGTMKSITYDQNKGEVSRNTFNVIVDN